MDVASALKASEVAFIAVGTPPADDSSADLRYVLEAVESIAMAMTSFLVRLLQNYLNDRF
jgi:UDPglucose 6-dehydrogenase